MKRVFGEHQRAEAFEASVAMGELLLVAPDTPAGFG